MSFFGGGNPFSTPVGKEIGKLIIVLTQHRPTFDTACLQLLQNCASLHNLPCRRPNQPCHLQTKAAFTTTLTVRIIFLFFHTFTIYLVVFFDTEIFRRASVLACDIRSHYLKTSFQILLICYYLRYMIACHCNFPSSRSHGALLTINFFFRLFRLFFLKRADGLLLVRVMFRRNILQARARGRDESPLPQFASLRAPNPSSTAVTFHNIF